MKLYIKDKNRLTHILRISKRDYCRILNDNKNNFKGIWGILNSIVRNLSKQKDYPEYFIGKDNVVCNKSEVAEIFNIYIFF